MTNAVVATAFGGPEVLSLIEVPLGRARPGEVQIEVRAAGANPIDYKSYCRYLPKRPVQTADAARLRGVRGGAGRRRPRGGTSGPGAPCWRRSYCVPCPGAYATEVVTKAANVLPKPTELSFEQAGGLLLTGITAYQTLHVTNVVAGETVLVHGAAGGVGSMVVQLAVAAGADVIGTASEPSHADLRELGADR